MRGAPITVFEITTAAALLLFAETPADVLLLEVGLGGRARRHERRSTARPPRSSRSIGHDHAEYLGDTLDKVAGREGRHLQARLPGRDRAAGLRRGRPVLRAEAERDRRRADPRRRRRISPCTRSAAASSTRTRTAFSICRARSSSGGTSSSMPGTAIAALRAAGFGSSRPPPSRPGMTRAEWPGRLQRLTEGPPAGARAGRLRDLARRRPQPRWRPGARRRHGRSRASAATRRSCSSPACSARRMPSGFFRNFAGLAREVIAVPIAGQIAARPADGGGRESRAGVGLTTSTCAERRGGARVLARLRLGPPAPHPDLRLPLPRRRGPGGERDIAGVKPKRSSRTAKPIRDRRPNRATEPQRCHSRGGGPEGPRRRRGNL